MAKLHFYYAAMNAGKTTTLLQSSYNYNERGMKTLIFLPTIDTRHNSTGRISSRIGLEQEASVFDRAFDFFPYIREKQQDMPELACVFVDEAQFLTKDQVQSLVNVVHFLHLPVLTYGLRTDFRGEAFEGSQYLLAWAEELIEIKTICHCGKKATSTLRVQADGSATFEGKQIEIGAEDRYVSVCRRHFEEARGLSQRQAEQAA